MLLSRACRFRGSLAVELCVQLRLARKPKSEHMRVKESNSDPKNTPSPVNTSTSHPLASVGLGFVLVKRTEQINALVAIL